MTGEEDVMEIKTELRIKLDGQPRCPDVYFVFRQYEDGAVAGEVQIETGDVVTSVEWSDINEAMAAAEKLFSGG